MPSVSLRYRGVCPLCRFRLRGFRIGSVRILKNSLKANGGWLVYIEATCPECGFLIGHPVEQTWALDEESEARVNAARAKKGWPLLGAAGRDAKRALG